jgi:LAO/AO transport system kinase
VQTCSALTGEGIQEVWRTVGEYQRVTAENGFLERTRREQARAWMDDTIRQTLEQRFRAHPSVAALMPGLERDVTSGVVPPLRAAQELLEAFFGERVHTL